jgi:hypothetical protein
MNKKQHLIISPEVIDQKDKAKVHISTAESWIDLRKKRHQLSIVTTFWIRTTNI